MKRNTAADPRTEPWPSHQGSPTLGGGTGGDVDGKLGWCLVGGKCRSLVGSPGSKGTRVQGVAKGGPDAGTTSLGEVEVEASTNKPRRMDTRIWLGPGSAHEQGFQRTSPCFIACRGARFLFQHSTGRQDRRGGEIITTRRLERNKNDARWDPRCGQSPDAAPGRPPSKHGRIYPGDKSSLSMRSSASSQLRWISSPTRWRYPKSCCRVP